MHIVKKGRAGKREGERKREEGREREILMPLNVGAHL